MWLPLAFQRHCHWITHAVSYISVFLHFQKTQNWSICTINGEAQGQVCVAMVKNIIQQQCKFLSLMWLPLAFQRHCHWITHAVSYISVFLHFQKTQNWSICTINGEAQGKVYVAMVKNIIQQQCKFFSLMWLPLAFQRHCHWITHAVSYISVFLHFQKTQNWRIYTINGEAQGQVCVAMVKNIIQQQYKFLSLMWLPQVFQRHCHWITHAGIVRIAHKIQNCVYITSILSLHYFISF